MKKWIVLIVGLTMACFISGCANFQSTTSSGTQSSSTTTLATTTTIASITTMTPVTTLSTGTTQTTIGTTSMVMTTASQPVTLEYLAKRWFTDLGQLQKTYYYYARTGPDQKKVEYSMKILSIKAVNGKSIRLDIVIGNQGISSILNYTFLDKDGNEFKDPLRQAAHTGSEGNYIEFTSETSVNLADYSQFILIQGLDGEKNNGITSVIFEIKK